MPLDRLSKWMVLGTSDPLFGKEMVMAEKEGEQRVQLHDIRAGWLFRMGRISKRAQSAEIYTYTQYGRKKEGVDGENDGLDRGGWKRRRRGRRFQALIFFLYPLLVLATRFPHCR